jgi:mevalonate kinase
MILNFIFILLILVILVSQIFIIKKLNQSISGFDLLLTKFIEVNQEFYEGQKKVAKKDNEVFEEIFKIMAEVGILRKQANQINTSNRNTNDIIKSLKEVDNKLNEFLEELIISKDLANALVNVSNNIKILDNVMGELKKSIAELKRRD